MFSLNDELQKLTSKITGTVADSAKSSAISTLSDPEFKAVVNQFTREWFQEHRTILLAVFGGFAVLSLLAVANIVTNLRVRR